ncbi:MAG: serine/threonine protein kinase [Micromonosporaceae bacterium]|nr:serine/threonine protein kinase [Micromonosporaceae bacterium]
MSSPQHVHVGPSDAPDRYELVQRFAVGGEGEVWKALEYHAGEPFAYAVKIINVEGDERPKERLEDLRMQAALAVHLEHPSVVKVKEVFVGPPPAGSSAGGYRLYFVMKWIEGRSLQDALEQGELRGTGVLSVLEPIAVAIDYLHSGRDTNGASVIHRDIKPANILIASDRRVYLVDFGLVRLRATDATSRIFGTAPFMAPESLARGEYTPATDRYTFGATVYYAMTGEMPVPGDPEGMIQRVCSVLGPGSDRTARGVVAMLSSQPERRPASAAAWIRALISPPADTSRAFPSPAASAGQLPPTGLAPPQYRPAVSGGRLGASPVSGYPVAPPPPPPPPPPFAGIPGYGTVIGPPPKMPKQKRSIGSIIGLIIAGLVVVMVGLCCVGTWNDIADKIDGNGGTSAGRSIDRSVPPPAVTVIEPALVSVADINAVTKTPQKDITKADPSNYSSGAYRDLVFGGLTTMSLCAEGTIASDAIGAHTTNAFDADTADGYVNITSSVAGFYGTYALEYFASAREQATRCGWQPFTVPKLGEESFGVFILDGGVNEPIAMVFVRSGQVLLRVAEQAGVRGAYQSDVVKLATKMAARLPKASR